jgi:hypothetical protein
MEPATHDDIWTNFLAYQPKFAERLVGTGVKKSAEAMIGDLWYAAGMCRLHYYRVKEALPAAGDIAAQAAYWKKYYNTPLGKGTVDEYLRRWNGK